MSDKVRSSMFQVNPNGVFMLKEFKSFAMKGNVVDLAVGVIIGGAFGKIVTSLVNDIIMPPLSLLAGKIDFSNLFISLSGETFTTLADAKKAGVPTLNYGLFINNIIDFVIVAFSIFLMVRQLNRFQEKKEETTKECPYCLTKVPKAATKCAGCASNLS